jgi:hypothetical protein
MISKALCPSRLDHITYSVVETVGPGTVTTDWVMVCCTVTVFAMKEEQKALAITDTRGFLTTLRHLLSA